MPNNFRLVKYYGLPRYLWWIYMRYLYDIFQDIHTYIYVYIYIFICICWLVVSNIFYFPSYLGCHPSHWLSYLSRCLKPPTSICQDICDGCIWYIYMIYLYDISKCIYIYICTISHHFPCKSHENPRAEPGARWDQFRFTMALPGTNRCRGFPTAHWGTFGDLPWFNPRIHPKIMGFNGIQWDFMEFYSDSMGC